LEFAEQPIFSPTPCSDSFLHDLSITTLAITEEEVVGELAGLNSSNSGGPDGIPATLLKCASYKIANSLTMGFRIVSPSLSRQRTFHCNR